MVRFSQEELERIRNGDNNPLKRIFNECFAVCVQQLKSYASCSISDAEDAVMDSFLVLRDKVYSGAFSNDNVQAYILTIARNKWRNKTKRDKRLLDINPAEIERVFYDVSDTDDIKVKRIKIILSSIELLSDKCRELLTKNIAEGVPLKELQTELNYSGYDVLKTSKSRCMKKLREIIERRIKESNLD